MRVPSQWDRGMGAAMVVLGLVLVVVGAFVGSGDRTPMVVTGLAFIAFGYMLVGG